MKKAISLYQLHVASALYIVKLYVYVVIKIKNLKVDRGSKGITAAAKRKETRSKILELACTKDSGRYMLHGHLYILPI